MIPRSARAAHPEGQLRASCCPLAQGQGAQAPKPKEKCSSNLFAPREESVFPWEGLFGIKKHVNNSTEQSPSRSRCRWLPARAGIELLRRREERAPHRALQHLGSGSGLCQSALQREPGRGHSRARTWGQQGQEMGTAGPGNGGQQS